MVDETSPSIDAPAPTPLSPFKRRELALMLVGLLGVVTLQLLLSNGWYLFTRHFWLDELYTYTLVADPDLGHALHALAAGVETHPPTPYLMLRVFIGLLGCQCEGAYRLVALAWMLAGLLSLYACLRNTYRPQVCATVVLILWAHTELLHYAFEARVYAIWFTASVWFACCLSRCRFPEATRRHHLTLALAASWLCSLHYLALLSWGLILLGEAAADRARLLWRWPVLLAATCGPGACLALLPLLLGQRAALTVPTWISPPFSGTLYFLVVSLIPPYFFALLAGLLALAWLARRQEAASPEIGLRPGFGLAGLTALAGLPAILVMASFTWQPMHLPRYALPALAAFAPLLAWALSRTPPHTAALVAVAATVLGTADLYGWTQQARARDQDIDKFIAALREQTDSHPVAFEMAVELLVVCHYAPDLSDRCGFLDFGEDGRASRHAPMIFNRDLTRVYVAQYGKPQLLSWDELRRQPSFYLVCEMQNWRYVLLEPNRFPGFTPRPIYLGLHEMTANPAPASP